MSLCLEMSHDNRYPYIIVFQAMNDYVGMCPLLCTTRVDTDTIDEIM